MRTRILYIVAISLVLGLVWSGALSNGFVWDDHILVEKNEAALRSMSLARALTQDFWVTDTESGHSRYYRPLVTISYMIDYVIHGMYPGGYHLSNILAHIAVAASLFTLLIMLSVSPLTAAVCVLVWGVHPNLGESVAWISGRTDTLATLFILLSVIVALQAYSARSREPRLKYLSAVLFGLALLCKESAIITPLLGWLLLPFATPKSNRPRGYWAPYIVVAAVWLIARTLALPPHQPHVVEEGVTPSIALLGFLHLWGAVLWPPFFRIEYGNSLTPSALYGGAIFGAMLIIGLLSIARSGGASRQAKALAVVALVCCAPALLAIGVKSIIGARLVYTASAFAVCSVVLSLISSSKGSAATWTLVASASLLALGTLQRSALWRDDQTLFSAALTAQNPSTRNRLNLGIALYNEGNLEGAYQQLVIQMDPAAESQRHYMLSLIYTGARCEALAEKELRSAIAAEPDNYAATHNLAGLLALQGKQDEALQTLNMYARNFPNQRQKALSQSAQIKQIGPRSDQSVANSEWCSDPAALQAFFTSPLPLNRQAGELLRRGQLELADVFLRAALRADPAFTGALLNMAQLRALSGDAEGARAILSEILSRQPGEERAKRLLEAVSRKTNQPVE